MNTNSAAEFGNKVIISIIILVLAYTVVWSIYDKTEAGGRPETKVLGSPLVGERMRVVTDVPGGMRARSRGAGWASEGTPTGASFAANNRRVNVIRGVVTRTHTDRQTPPTDPPPPPP